MSIHSQVIRSIAVAVALIAGAAGSARAQATCTPDATSPVITSLSATPNTLWSPNHKFVAVSVTAVATDNCNPAPVCSISSISSNEPVNGLGDGDTAPDWRITSALKANLRAERSGTGTGRVYTLAVSCRDAAGNVTNGTTTVTVPHDQGKGSAEAATSTHKHEPGAAKHDDASHKPAKAKSKGEKKSKAPSKP